MKDAWIGDDGGSGVCNYEGIESLDVSRLCVFALCLSVSFVLCKRETV